MRYLTYFTINFIHPLKQYNIVLYFKIKNNIKNLKEGIYFYNKLSIYYIYLLLPKLN